MGPQRGYFGGWIDQAISRVIEILLTIPTFFLIIAIIAFLPPSIYNIMAVIGITGWTGVARFVRAEFLRLKQLDFVLASRALGASHFRLIFIHMLPNAMAPVLVSAVFGIAGAILTESSLSFLGFGVPPRRPPVGVTSCRRAETISSSPGGSPFSRGLPSLSASPPTTW